MVGNLGGGILSGRKVLRWLVTDWGEGECWATEQTYVKLSFFIFRFFTVMNISKILTYVSNLE